MKAADYAEALKSRLAQQPTTSAASESQTPKGQLRLPFDTQTAELLLADFYRREVESRGAQFRADDDTLTHISRVAQMLTGESRKFGLMLCGLCGNGKTTLARALQHMLWNLQLRRDDYSQWTVSFYDATILAHECPRLAERGYGEWVEMCRKPVLAIDDLGEEPVEIQHFSKVYTPMEDLLKIRYAQRLFTIVTTNKTPEELSERYGKRIADRLREMMEIIVFCNGSYRG